MLTDRRSLGLAVTEQGITAVEIGTSGGRRTLQHSAVLPFSNNLSLDEPEKLGKELRQVLRQHGFQASRCVIGVAAGWIVAREKQLPPTDPDSLRGILSIAAEREFASGPQELAFDYLQSDSEKGISALLVAAPLRVVSRLEAMAKASGLSLTAITCSATALALATKGPVGQAGRLVLNLLPRGVELTGQSANGVRIVRHLPVRMDQPDARAQNLTGELRRVLSLGPLQSDNGSARELLVWDSLGLDHSALASVEHDLGLPMRICDLASDLEIAPSPSIPMGQALAQATALAGSADHPPAIDFLHSRLAARKKSRIGRGTQWALVGAAVLLAAVLFLVLDWRSGQREIAGLNDQLDSLAGGSKQATEMVEQVSFADAWYDRRPRYLDCLREIAQAFPQEGRIWASSLVVREDMQVMLTGKTVDKATALEVRDRLASNSKLAKVNLLFLRQGGGRSQDWNFAISLNHRGGAKQ